MSSSFVNLHNELIWYWIDNDDRPVSCIDNLNRPLVIENGILVLAKMPIKPVYFPNTVIKKSLFIDSHI